jgi:hypothetical protein
VDRVVQQAVLQILEPIFEPTFHPGSHGFRPHRGAHAAIAQAKEHLEAEYQMAVDFDLSKFFDRVHHQRLLDRIAQRVSERRLLACAVERRRFPVGASPTRQPLQPEATGAVMEVTKWLKPLVSVSRYTVTARVQAVTRVNAEQVSKMPMHRPT